MNQEYGQQQNSEQEYYIPPRKKHSLIAFGLILIVIIGAVGLYFAIKPKLESAMKSDAPTLANTDKKNAELQTAGQFAKVEITSLKLCDSVDANFVCTENKERVFKRGDSFYVYAEVIASGFRDGSNIMFTQELKITDENQKQLTYAKESLEKVNSQESVSKIPLKTKFTVTDDTKLGKQILIMTTIDTKTNQKTSKTIEYEIL